MSEAVMVTPTYEAEIVTGAEALYAEIIQKYPNREEAKDAAFDRLLNIYNSDPSTLPPEVDQYLATNPSAERADQAKFFKAEALYKQQNYPRAAPIFAELRASASAQQQTSALP